MEHLVAQRATKCRGVEGSPMPSDDSPASKRSRFANVVHVNEVPPEAWRSPGGRIDVESREVAVMLGRKDLGYCVTTVRPGGRSCPFHFHHSEEEVFYVLSGRGVLRQGDGKAEDERIELAAGDVVSFPAGTGIAHQFLNEGTEPFTYLAFSTIVRGDVAEYPDSDKVNIRSTRTILRRGPRLEYFDGEE
jgi:uncharacterized cupin superfamily protein